MIGDAFLTRAKSWFLLKIRLLWHCFFLEVINLILYLQFEIQPFEYRFNGDEPTYI